MAALVLPPELCVNVRRDLDQHPVDALPARPFCEDVRPGVEVVKDGLPNPETFLVLLEGGRHLKGHVMVQLACQAEGEGIVQKLGPEHGAIQLGKGSKKMSLLVVFYY